MATVDEITILVKAEVDKAIANLNKLEKESTQAETAAGKLGKTFAKMRDFMQGPVAAFNAVSGAIKSAFGAMDNLISGAVESERSMSNLKSVLLATGGVAGITFSEMNKLAENLSGTTLFDDDQLRQAQSVLLTFKSIGKDIFPQATKAAADLSTVMGMDLQSATVMLGKELQEPVSGVSAMRRVGIGLTETQEKQIKSFMELNDVASAQALIMKEVNSQVGGAAESAAKTATGSYQQMKKAIDDMMESFGKMLAETNKTKFDAISESVKKVQQSFDDKGMLAKVTDEIKNGVVPAYEELQRAMSYAQKITLPGGTGGGPGGKVERDNALKSITLMEKMAATSKFMDEEKAKRDKIKQENILAIQKQEEEAAKAKIEADKRIAEYEKQLAEQQKQAIEDAKRSAESYAKFRQAQVRANLEVIMDGFAKEKEAEVKRFSDFKTRLEKEQELFAKIAKTKEDKENEEQIRKEENLKKWVDLTISAGASMAEAFGSALVAGEEGWKAFGKAGLNAIAAVLEALGAQWALQAASAWAAVAGGGIGLTQIPSAIGYTAAAASAYVAAGAVKAIPLAEGGVVTSPTHALIGEAGPEAVIPLKKMGSMGTTVVINQNISGSVWNTKQLESLALGAYSKAMRSY